ncbi:hypothetical protein [Rossellomorea sp. DUT-2]|uniref:hypothetical protein n=1 Tax=Rossellomorea sp. DUT-2 TaxID=3412021 RepID=UPI003D171AF3
MEVSKQCNEVGEERSGNSRLSKEDILLFIAPLTALSYALTYLFKVSYLAYYKVPSMWIDLSITRITSTLLKISPILFLGAICSLIFFKTAKKIGEQNNKNVKKGKYLRKLAFISSLIVTLLSGYMVFGMYKIYGVYMLLSSSTGALVPIIALFLYKFYREGRYYLSVVILWLTLCAVTASYGFGSAGMTEKYFTFNKDKQNYIVIDSYNEYLIVAPYNKNYFYSKVSLVEMKEVGSLTYKKVGRLKRKAAN